MLHKEEEAKKEFAKLVEQKKQVKDGCFWFLKNRKQIMLGNLIEIIKGF